MFYITSISRFRESNAIDDAKRNEGLTTPEGARRFDDLRYGPDARNVLDVYRPKDCEGRLPVIVSIHGGWGYGNKEIMQFYCMSLAELGFSVVSFNCRLAPIPPTRRSWGSRRRRAFFRRLSVLTADCIAWSAAWSC